MKNVTLNFGGFYYSIHDDLINSQLGNYFSDDEGETFDYDEKYNIDYSLIQDKYCKLYLDWFETFLNDVYSLDLKLHYKGLWRPKFYNFETDQILIEVSEKNASKILNFETDEIKKYIDEHSRSYDGFASFYEGYEEVKKDTEIHLQYIFNFLLAEFNENELLDSYDFYNGYEMLYNLDFYSEGV